MNAENILINHGIVMSSPLACVLPLARGFALCLHRTLPNMLLVILVSTSLPCKNNDDDDEESDSDKVNSPAAFCCRLTAAEESALALLLLLDASRLSSGGSSIHPRPRRILHCASTVPLDLLPEFIPPLPELDVRERRGRRGFLELGDARRRLAAIRCSFVDLLMGSGQPDLNLDRGRDSRCHRRLDRRTRSRFGHASLTGAPSSRDLEQLILIFDLHCLGLIVLSGAIPTVHPSWQGCHYLPSADTKPPPRVVPTASTATRSVPPLQPRALYIRLLAATTIGTEKGTPPARWAGSCRGCQGKI